MLARQGSHLPQSLRPGRLGPRRRAQARRLGRHQGLHREGPRLAGQRGEGVGPARARRRGFRDRAQVVVHAQAGRRPAALSRGQCRRVRARHLQGPRDHAARSASSDRGLPLCRRGDGRERRLHLHPRRIRARARAPAGGDRPGLRGQADRQEQRPRLGLRPLRPPRRRRLYLRRGNRAARKPRRQEGPAAAQAAVPGQHGPLRLPDHGQQCRDHRAGAGHPAPRRGVVRRHRPRRTTPAPSSSASPATSSGRAMSKRRWAFRCAS